MQVAPGLVNQVGYLCDTGERLTVSYFSHRGAAALIRGETAYELQQVPAASGVSYVGRGVILHGKGVELLVDTNGSEQLACRASDSSFPRTP